MQFRHIDSDMPDFLEYYTGSVAIPNINAEWKKPSGNGVFTHTQFPLNLSWEFTIHKIQGKTLERLVIDVGAGEKCSALTLVELLRVKMFKYLLLKPLTFKRLRKVNTSSGSVDIKNALTALKKRPLLQDLSIQPSFNTDAIFHSYYFTEKLLIYLSYLP